ncbi:uncharacterized protein PAN0_079d6629 [Moesziomyces antarcticus]|uniref:WW domain-containing protein n=1 Tax=Pseudozyma antarctica TaxID=84753 RepID=A0A081CNY5_PSEA2|nr:uncharacterized protein PAN0_079d6629 [Moesziomyces antarcticus]GAK68381.1 hypothetical protein PAN0_079d6629 [Moesziomyces antarcticus]
MLEEEEAVDYGEDELLAPTHAQDEVQLTLDGDDTAADTDAHATPDDAKSPTPAAVEVVAEASKDERQADAKERPASERPAASSGKSEGRSNGAGNKTDGSRRESHKEALPAGWREIASRSGDGEVYYYNERTGESSWQKPGAARTPPSGSTPKSKKKNKKRNKRTREAAQAAQAAQGANGKPDAEVAAGDAKDTAAQGLSIKGAAQRKAEPCQPKPDAGKNGKRKREERIEVGSKPKASESKTNGGSGTKASVEAKRPRADERRDVRAEERREARSNDVRRTGDSWRPSTDNSARSRPDQRSRDGSRRSDARDNRRDSRDPRERDHARHDRDHAPQQRNASSINSTHAHHKRQWGTVSSK